MKNVVWAACLGLSVATLAGAQEMKAPEGKMHGMADEKSYAGCLERSATGAYQLTHVMAVPAGAPMKDGMKETMTDSMKEPMTHSMKDSMAGSMKDGGSMKVPDSMDGRSMKESLALSAGAGVDLGKHVGHKVTVKGTAQDGMHGMTTFTVTSLQMAGRSCS